MARRQAAPATRRIGVGTASWLNIGDGSTRTVDIAVITLLCTTNFALGSTRLPDAERRRVRQITLLAPGAKADFEIHVSGWIGGPPHPDALPIAPELLRLDPGLLQCVYGAEEKAETGCALLIHSEVIATEGGHHFDGDYAAITRQIVNGLVARGALPAPG